MSKTSSVFKIPLKTFNPDNLLEEMKKANDGDVFVINEENIGPQIGDNRIELTIAQIRKVKDEPISVASRGLL